MLGCLALCAICIALVLTLRPATPAGNFDNEMKIPK